MLNTYTYVITGAAMWRSWSGGCLALLGRHGSPAVIRYIKPQRD